MPADLDLQCFQKMINLGSAEERVKICPEPGYISFSENSVDQALRLQLEFILELKIKRNDWLLADTCPQAANRYTLF